MPFVDPNTIHNPAAGGVAPAAWGDTVRDDLVFLANPPRVRVRPSAAQSIPNATWTALTFDTEDWDTDTLHSTTVNTSRLTATTAGVYDVRGINRYAANATGWRLLAIRKNGVADSGRVSGPAVSAGHGLDQPILNDIVLAVGDYVELFTYQDSGGALSTVVGEGAPVFSARWVSL